MNKTFKNILIVGGVGAVVYAIYKFYVRQIGLIQNYDYKIIGAKIKKISGNNVQFDTKVRFFNKSKIEVEVQKIYLDVYLEDTLTGFVVENRPFIIASNGSSDIDLQMTFNPQSILKSLASIVLSGFKKKDLKGWTTYNYIELLEVLKTEQLFN